MLLMILALSAASSFAEVDHQPEVSRQEIDQSLQDLNQVLTEARAVPHIENGEPAGFQVIPVHSANGVYENLTLKPTDDSGDY